MNPFSLQVPDDELNDLQARLALTRFPDQAPGDPWAYGTSVDYMREIIAYWQDGFDWRAAEARLNAFPQFKQRVGDIDVHFLRVEGKGPDPRTLLLCHGWPGSIYEFLDIIPRLTDPAAFGGDPADAVTVIAPSLPGYGLSFQPGQRRSSCEDMAETLAGLMEVLGYDRYAMQGGDWGCFVTSRIAYDHPDRIIGLHLNMLPIRRDLKKQDDMTVEEALYVEELAHFLKEETGYQVIQGTRPQTLAFGLNDSPLGLAAWIIEKFRIWSDCDGDVETVHSKDAMLANISLYWFTGAIGSSFWPYYARLHGPWPIPNDGPITVPTAYAAFPKEILRPPRSLGEMVYKDIRQWTVMAKGGHFAAMEQSEALAADVLKFFRAL